MGTMVKRVEKQLITNLPTSKDPALRDARSSEPQDSSISPNDELSSQLSSVALYTPWCDEPGAASIFDKFFGFLPGLEVPTWPSPQHGTATRAVTSCSVLWLRRILILCRMFKHLSIEQLKQHIADGAYVGHSAAAQGAAKQQPKEMRSASLSPWSKPSMRIENRRPGQQARRKREDIGCSLISTAARQTIQYT